MSTILSRTFATLLLASAAAAGPSSAQSLELAPERLTRVDTLLQRYVDEGRIAGAVVLLLQDGTPVYERAVGWSDREAGVLATPRTTFRIASQTKALTSVAILMLLEEGRLTLDEPVGRHIPSFLSTTVALPVDDTIETVPAKRAITIRDLLTHTAGIPYGTTGAVAEIYEEHGFGRAAGSAWYTADRDEPVCTTMERLGTLPFSAQPGESWVYGYGTDVLGCVVERASGIDLAEFIRSRITEPLGMSDTHFYLDHSQRGRLAAVYASDSAGLAVRAPEGARGQGHYVDGPRRSFSGGAGLVSTAHDYARFLEMVRNGGTLDGVRILAPRTVKLMTTNQVGSLYPANGLGWSLAFETTERYGASGMAAAGSYGWGGAYGSWYRVDPDAGLVIVFMIQLMPNATDIAPKFFALVYQALTDSSR